MYLFLTTSLATQYRHAMEKSDHMRSIDLTVDQVYYSCFQEVCPLLMCNKILGGKKKRKKRTAYIENSCTNLATWGWDQGDKMSNFDEFPKSRYAIFLSCYTCVPNMGSCWAVCLVLTLRLRVKIFVFMKTWNQFTLQIFQQGCCLNKTRLP